MTGPDRPRLPRIQARTHRSRSPSAQPRGAATPNGTGRNDRAGRRLPFKRIALNREPADTKANTGNSQWLRDAVQPAWAGRGLRRQGLSGRDNGADDLRRPANLPQHRRRASGLGIADSTLRPPGPGTISRTVTAGPGGNTRLCRARDGARGPTAVPAPAGQPPASPRAALPGARVDPGAPALGQWSDVAARGRPGRRPRLPAGDRPPRGRADGAGCAVGRGGERRSVSGTGGLVAVLSGHRHADRRAAARRVARCAAVSDGASG